jgi:hypothetical protein
MLNMGLCSVDVALSTISSFIDPLLRAHTSFVLPSASLSRFMLSVLGFSLQSFYFLRIHRGATFRLRHTRSDYLRCRTTARWRKRFQGLAFAWRRFRARWGRSLAPTPIVLIVVLCLQLGRSEAPDYYKKRDR